MRKGQIEVVGLVVIVLILIFGALIFLRLYIGSSSSVSYDESLLLSQKANNLANSLKGVDVCNSNMADAMISCCSGEPFCGREACGFFSEETAKIVNLTLSGEKVGIDIKDKEGRTCTTFSNGRCTSEFVAASPSPIKGVLGSAELLVKICRK